jgi:hypothetical protein
MPEDAVWTGYLAERTAILQVLFYRDGPTFDGHRSDRRRGAVVLGRRIHERRPGRLVGTHDYGAVATSGGSGAVPPR